MDIIPCAPLNYKEEHVEERYIIAPASIGAELSAAELEVVAARGLLEDVVDPAFHCCTCNGILNEYSRETDGDKDKAARLWMEEHFDSMYAAQYAIGVLIGEAAEILQLLPRAEQRKAEKQKEG